VRINAGRVVVDEVRSRWGVALGSDSELAALTQLPEWWNETAVRRDLGLVVRIYRAGVRPDRVAALQTARGALGKVGIPIVPLLPSRRGTTLEVIGDRVVEVESFVPHDGRMNTPIRLRRGAAVLAQVHDVLRNLDLGPAAEDCAYANWIDPADVPSGVRAGIERIRSWADPQDSALVDNSRRLAGLVSAAENAMTDARRAPVPRQLVHGDFWDDNVYLRGETIVAVTDLDFLGLRPRVDDLALMLYFGEEEQQLHRPDDRTIEERIGLLAPIVVTYASNLQTPLSEAEWRALPWALARQPLWGIGHWVPQLPSEAHAQHQARDIAPAVRRALAIADAPDLWLVGLRS